MGKIDDCFIVTHKGPVGVFAGGGKFAPRGHMEDHPSVPSVTSIISLYSAPIRPGQSTRHSSRAARYLTSAFIDNLYVISFRRPASSS